MDELKKANNLTSNILSTGQLLKIPSALLPESTYIVKKGDSLYSIANKYNTTVDELKRINNLTSNILSIGQVLKLPSDKVSDVEKEENTISYTVQKGDSLYSIARKYSTTIDKIKDLNNLTTNLLSIGQVLLIPTDTNLETTYTVQKGDSLYSIAKKYDTTVDRLKQLNNLKSNFQCYFFCFQYIILNRTISPTSIPSYGIDVFFFQYTLITRDCFLTFFTNMYISRLHQDSFIVNQLLCCYHPIFF